MSTQSNIAFDGHPGNVAAGGEYVQMRLPDEKAAETYLNSHRREGRAPAQSSDSPEARAKFRSFWKKALTAAEGLKASAEGDRSEMFVRAVDLNDAVEQMWELRDLRDDNWIGIVELVRTSFETLAAKNIETSTPDQCWKLLQLVEDYLNPSTKSIEDLTAAVQLVAEMNINPYAGLEPLADS
jgi:hypothetical protein